MQFTDALKVELSSTSHAGVLLNCNNKFEGVFAVDLAHQEASLRLCLHDFSSSDAASCSLWKTELNDNIMTGHVSFS